MRSDFYSLPWAAQQAIRKGGRDAHEADMQARSVSDLRDRITSLESERDALKSALAETHNERASLVRALTEIREVVQKRQLPITNQVFEIADTALSTTKTGEIPK